MFETRTEIRRATRAKAIEKAIKKDRDETTTRLREELENLGVEFADEVVARVYGSNNGRKQGWLAS